MTCTRYAIGVVVPCKNEIDTIELCLKAVRAQEPAPAFVLVVDNGSTDGSLDVARQFADEVVVLPQASIAGLRNAGARAVARALPDVEVVGFVDADCEVGPGWAAAAIEALGEGADLVGCRTRAADGDTWVARRWAAIEAHQAHGASHVWSQHLAIGRATFERLAGFDERLDTGEDADLSARVRQGGGVVALVPAMDVVHHGFPSRLLDFVRREQWHTSSPGWYERMSTKSRLLVMAWAGWLLLGALSAVLVRRHERPLVAWAAGTALAVPALGYVSARSGPYALADGVLMTVWTTTRSLRLARELLACGRGEREGAGVRRHRGAGRGRGRCRQ